MQRISTPLSLLAASLATLGFVSACGGGDATPASSSVSGAVVKGPVGSADVCFYQLSGGAKGAQIACTKTDSAGAYSITLAYVGDVLVEATGGSYTDEATGAKTSLGDPLQLVLSAQSGATVGYVTPLTTVAVSLSKGLSGGLSSSNFGAAATDVAKQFQLGSVDPVKSKPDVSSGTSDAYGKALRALSEYIKAGGTLKAFTEFKDPAALATAYSGAYKTATGQTITYSFNGSDKIVIGGTGAGGGSGTCGVAVTGSAAGVPLNFNYCIQGIAAGSCTSGNASISSAITSAATFPAGVTLNYTYSPTCAAGATTITLK